MQLLWSLVYFLTVAITVQADSEHIQKIPPRVKNVTPAIQTNERRDVRLRTCRTHDCQKIAKQILRNRNLSVNPCDDFYEYACGSWKAKHPIPDNELEWSENQIIEETTLLRIKNVLEEEDKLDDIPPVTMVKRLYRSCMDTAKIEKEGIAPIDKILERTGGFAIMMSKSEWDARNVSWQTIDQQYAAITGNNAFFNINYEINENNTNRYILRMDPYVESAFALHSKGKLNQIVDYNAANVYGISSIIEIYAKQKEVKLNRPDLLVDVVNMLDFGSQLDEITQRGRRKNVNRKRKTMTIEELQKWYDSFVSLPIAKINFLESIQALLKIGNVSVNASEPITIHNRSFLLKLIILLERTEERVLVNYIQYGIVNALLPLTTQMLRDINANIGLERYNVSTFEPRWKICTTNIEMKHAVSYLFVKKYFKHFDINKVLKMIDTMQEELQRRVLSSEWVPDTLKLFLTKKLQNINKQIAYPDWYGNNTALIKEYEGLSIGSDYFENILNCRTYELGKSIKQFRETVNTENWLDYPTTLNAFYSEESNTIIIPAAELQDPYFAPLFPDAINYGSAGFIVGHELSHSFDTDGIHLDEKGRMITWKPDELLTEYTRRATCFAEQYGNYTFEVTDVVGDVILVNGVLTEDENIADSTGLKIAYEAFKKASKLKKYRVQLPGLEEISEKQLFFLSYANVWCATSRPEYMRDIANIDEHSPYKVRVIGAVSNMQAFASAFECPPNSPMNPEKKCNIWS